MIARTTIERRLGFIVIRRGVMPPKAIREQIQAPPTALDLPPSTLADHVSRTLRGRTNFPRDWYEEVG